MLTTDSNSPCGVLYVDDEEIALKYFRLTFASKYPIFTAPSAEEGLAILRREAGSIGVVISDQRMPEMSGSDFLGEVRSIAPTTVRILTTAYSNLESAIAAVNKGFIYQYVMKPWEVEDLEMILGRAVEYHRVLTERNQLLAVKLTFLQRMLFADRIRMLVLFGEMQGEFEVSGFTRALSALVVNAPLSLFEKQFLGRAALETFDFTKLLPEEVENGRKFLQSWQSLPANNDIVGEFKSALATRFGLDSNLIEVASSGSSVECTIRSNVKRADLEESLFSLLSMSAPEAVSVLLLKLLVLLPGQDRDTLLVRLVGTDSVEYLYKFTLQGDGAEVSDPLDIFFNRISAYDISKL